jgi:hypothetical protein
VDDETQRDNVSQDWLFATITGPAAIGVGYDWIELVPETGGGFTAGARTSGDSDFAHEANGATPTQYPFRTILVRPKASTYWMFLLADLRTTS